MTSQKCFKYYETLPKNGFKYYETQRTELVSFTFYETLRNTVSMTLGTSHKITSHQILHI